MSLQWSLCRSQGQADVQCHLGHSRWLMFVCVCVCARALTFPGMWVLDKAVGIQRVMHLSQETSGPACKRPPTHSSHQRPPRAGSFPTTRWRQLQGLGSEDPAPFPPASQGCPHLLHSSKEGFPLGLPLRSSVPWGSRPVTAKQASFWGAVTWYGDSRNPPQLSSKGPDPQALQWALWVREVRTSMAVQAQKSCF